jgi:hypothetical protein
MTDEEEMKETYGAVAKAIAPSGETFFRFESIALPTGCRPEATQALLVVNGRARPAFYVKPGIRVPNGVDPRGTSVVQLQGEAWLQFSYSFPWEWDTNTLVQFVGASLRRFAKPE